jgi:hypothetical protein
MRLVYFPPSFAFGSRTTLSFVLWLNAVLALPLVYVLALHALALAFMLFGFSK